VRIVAQRISGWLAKTNFNGKHGWITASRAFFDQLYRTWAYSANLNFQNRINNSLYPLLPR